MLAILLRRKATTLIWQYLDGAIPADRFELLQKLLSKHSAVRRQFVDCAALNALLYAYFNPGRYSTTPSLDGQPLPIDELTMLSPNDGDADLDDRGTRERVKRPAG